MATETKSKLSGYKFVKEVPRDLVRIPGFLENDFGRDFLEEFQGRARADYRDVDALKVLEFNGTVTNSNSYSVVLANQVLPEKVRTATPAEIGEILKSGTLDLGGIYVDTALVLRPQGDLRNKYLTNDLIEQLKSRGHELGETPIMVPLAGLQLSRDQDSPSELAFKLTDASQIIQASQLSIENDYKNFDELDENGLPIFRGNGNRTNYTGNSTLSRLYGYRYGYLDSRDGGLADSDEGGRVVIVDAEGVAP